MLIQVYVKAQYYLFVILESFISIPPFGSCTILPSCQWMSVQDIDSNMEQILLMQRGNLCCRYTSLEIGQDISREERVREEETGKRRPIHNKFMHGTVYMVCSQMSLKYASMFTRSENERERENEERVQHA